MFPEDADALKIAKAMGLFQKKNAEQLQLYERVFGLMVHRSPDSGGMVGPIVMQHLLIASGLDQLTLELVFSCILTLVLMDC